MNEQHLDLILALAEGRLTGPERAEAEALLAADPELAAELDLQRRALTALAATEPARMTAAERSELRSALRTHLGFDRPPAAQPARRTGPGWIRWLVPAVGVAAVAVAFVAIGGTGGGSSEDLAQVVVTATTSTQEFQGAEDRAADSAAGGVEMSEAAPETLSSGDTAATTTTGARAEAEPVTLEPTLDTYVVPVLSTERLSALQQDGATTVEVGETGLDVAIARADLEACLAALADAVGSPISVTPIAAGGDTVLLEIVGTGRLVTLDLSDCSVTGP